MNKAARANAHSAATELSSVSPRRGGEKEWEMYPDGGPLALRACEQFREMIQLRVCDFMRRYIEDASILTRGAISIIIFPSFASDVKDTLHGMSANSSQLVEEKKAFTVQ